MPSPAPARLERVDLDVVAFLLARDHAGHDPGHFDASHELHPQHELELEHNREHHHDDSPHHDHLVHADHHRVNPDHSGHAARPGRQPARTGQQEQDEMSGSMAPPFVLQTTENLS